MPAFNYEESFGCRPNSHQGTVYNRYDRSTEEVEKADYETQKQEVSKRSTFSCSGESRGEKFDAYLIENPDQKMDKVIVFTEYGYSQRPRQFAWGRGNDWDRTQMARWVDHQLIFGFR